MRPIFTVHAGEYLVATEIERKFPGIDVWIPAKDRGVDLLVTDPQTKAMISLQVKFSKDFTENQRAHSLERSFKATGWWTHKRSKIESTPADLWVFVLRSFEAKDTSFVLIPPRELLRRLTIIHAPCGETIHSYFWVTREEKARCYETRGLSKNEISTMITGKLVPNKRDFTTFLNNWDPVAGKLKQKRANQVRAKGTSVKFDI